jgi:hypothetical protein
MKEWITPHGRVELRNGTYIAYDQEEMLIGWAGTLEEAKRYLTDRGSAVLATRRRKKFIYQYRDPELVLKRLSKAAHRQRWFKTRR